MVTALVEDPANQYLVDPPEWNDQFGELYYSAEVPLPIALNTILQRLRNSYYRSVAAVATDAQLLRQNAEKFNGKNDEEVVPAARAATSAILSVLERHVPREEAVALRGGAAPRRGRDGAGSSRTAPRGAQEATRDPLQ